MSTEKPSPGGPGNSKTNVEGVVRKLPNGPLTMSRDTRDANVAWRVAGMRNGPTASGVVKGTFWTGVAITAWLNWVAYAHNYGNNVNSPRLLPEISGSTLDNSVYKDLVETATNDFCGQVHSREYFTRFFQPNGDGTSRLNWGALIVPLGVEVEQKCGTKIKVEIRLPSEFSRQFVNTKSLTPEQEKEIVEKLAQLFGQKLQDQIVLRGLWDSLDIYAANAKGGRYFKDGVVILDLNDTKLEKGTVVGLASDEAGIGGGKLSIGRADPENEKLAKQRLDDVWPLVREAFERVGRTKDDLSRISTRSEESILKLEEIANLAKIHDEIFGRDPALDNAEKTFRLIAAANSNDPRVTSYFKEEKNKAARNLYNSLIVEKRGVGITLEVEGSYRSVDVYHVSVPIVIPIFALMTILFSLPGRKRRERELKELDRLMRGEDIEIL